MEGEEGCGEWRRGCGEWREGDMPAAWGGGGVVSGEGGEGTCQLQNIIQCILETILPYTGEK